MSIIANVLGVVPKVRIELTRGHIEGNLARSSHVNRLWTSSETKSNHRRNRRSESCRRSAI